MVSLWCLFRTAPKQPTLKVHSDMAPEGTQRLGMPLGLKREQRWYSTPRMCRTIVGIPRSFGRSLAKWRGMRKAVASRAKDLYALQSWWAHGDAIGFIWLFLNAGCSLEHSHWGGGGVRVCGPLIQLRSDKAHVKLRNPSYPLPTRPLSLFPSLPLCLSASLPLSLSASYP